MTDRELLEAAAKAAGVPLRVVGAKPGLYALYPETDGVDRMRCMQQWNPLTDDGDALRLAVAKQMMIQHTTSYVTVFVHTVCAEQISESVWRGDRNAATRRAIVRAAAMASSKQQVNAKSTS